MSCKVSLNICHCQYNRTEGVSNKLTIILKTTLQHILTLQLFTINIKRKLFTKVIKNTQLDGLGGKMYTFIKRGGKEQALKVGMQNCLIKSRECFKRVIPVVEQHILDTDAGKQLS